VVDLDVYYRTDDPDMRALACGRHADQQAQLAAGVLAGDNTVFPLIAALAVEDPDGESPILPGATNREAFLTVAGATFLVFTVTPWYHLAAPGYSDEAAILGWFADARPWQSLQEIDDGDALWCGLTPPGVVGDLSAVRIPLLHVGAAGGFGALGLHTTTLVGGEVDVLFVSDRAPGEELLDVGHADLLFAPRARPVWDEIAVWLRGR
jgi:hypothetical protein